MKQLMTWALGASLCAVIAGCQSYEARPLDLGSHREAWVARSADDETVAAFASSLVDGDLASDGPFDASDGLSVSEGEVVALVYNPDLRLARLRAGVAAAGAAHSGRWDDPELSLDVLRITESVPDPWIVGVGLSFTLPVSGRLGVERARDAARSLEALEAVVDDEYCVRRDVRVAWAAWSAAALERDSLRALLTRLDPLVDSTAELADAGEMFRTESALFALERATRAHELARAEGAVEEAEQSLRALLGLSTGAPVVFEPWLGGSAVLEGAMSAVDAVAAHPSLARWRRAYVVAELTLEREVRKQFPDLTIGPAYESEEGQSRIGFGGGIPVPVLNANRRGIAEAEAERELARAVYETAFERLAGSFARVRARASSLAAQREAIETTMVPLVDRQLEDARRLLELGEGGGLVLLESLTRAHEMKTRLIEIRRDEAEAEAELAYLTRRASADGTDTNGDHEVTR